MNKIIISSLITIINNSIELLLDLGELYLKKEQYQEYCDAIAIIKVYIEKIKNKVDESI